jgi:rhodanese-related sulfurtransferase/uncharacterized protein YndB with AHSA1/START domain
VTPDRDPARTVTRAIRAPADEAWAALTESGIVRKWLGEISPGFRVGRLSQLQIADGDLYALEIFQMEPPHRLTYGRRRFGIDVKEKIDWQVAARAGGCLVTVSYSAPDLEDDRWPAEREEWLFHTSRLEKYLTSAPLPPAPPDRELVLRTDLPGDRESVWERLCAYLNSVFDGPRNDAGEYRATLPWRDGLEPSEVRAVVRADPAASAISLELDRATWLSATSALIVLRQRAQGTRLSIRHRGWEGTAFDDETRAGQRKRFAAFWHRFLLRFTLEYARSWQIPTLSAADLKARMELPEVFVFDANRATLWERGHVPRAVFVGQEDIPLDRLPPDKDAELVFYCRDTMCLTAYLSAAQARTLGYRSTFVMEGGRKAWAESGFSLVPENGADVLELDQTDADGA